MSRSNIFQRNHNQEPPPARVGKCNQQLYEILFKGTMEYSFWEEGLCE